MLAVANLVPREVADLCRFHTSAGLEARALADRAPYDLIVANILAGPLVELSASFTVGRRLLLSGLLLEQADMVLSAYRERGFTEERHVDLETGGAIWRSLLLRRS